MRAKRGRHGTALPPLWLFTDAARLPDPLPAIRALPRGLAGVVFRPEGTLPGRTRDLAQRVARACRTRRLALVVAGDPRLAAALGAGVHLRRGRWPGLPRPRRRPGTLVTSSAHDRIELVRARRRRVDLAFLSPAYATSSHPATRPIGPVRWNALARAESLPVAALGGVSGATLRRLGRHCPAVAAISALA